MSFREVQTLDAEVTIALGGRNKKTGKANPTSAEGYFLGSRQVDSKKSKNGKASIHFLQTAEGNLGVWGKTDLDRKLSAVTPGTMVRITQSGMVATPNGDMYKYKVEIDESNTIEVAAQILDTTSSGAGAYASGTEDEDTAEAGSDESEDTYEAQEVASNSALAAMERKQKVEALLKSTKNNGVSRK